MKAKVLWAEGMIDEAIEIYKTNFPSWYQTVGQKCEQLFAKDSLEFALQLRHNMYELTNFAANKKLKEIWFCNGLILEEKIEEGIKFCEAIQSMRKNTG